MFTRRLINVFIFINKLYFQSRGELLCDKSSFQKRKIAVDSNMHADSQVQVKIKFFT